MLLLLDVGLMNAQSIERIPRYFSGYSQANPLCHNLLFTFKHRTTRMFRKARIHCFRFGVNVTEKDGVELFWLNVHTRVAKVGVSTSVCYGTIPEQK